MQKRWIKIFFTVAVAVLISSTVSAGIISLPRYTGEFAYRTSTGGRDGVCSSSYQYTCSGTGYSGGSGASCGGKYQSCICTSDYKWSGGKCVLKSCSDYGYLASKDTSKSCTEKTPRTGLTCYSCTGCDTNVYKYNCSGGINSTTQSSNSCNSLYDECSCVTNATWNATSGKCECKTDYKVSGTSCVLKTCSDYGYLESSDSTKSCTSKTPRTGLTCYSCTDCDSSYKYNCSSITNASGGDGSSCGGKYQKCTCKSGYYWSNGSCVKSCTAVSCEGATACNGKSCTIFKSSAITNASELGTGIGSYASCSPTNCSGTSYKYGYLPTACATGYAGYDIGDCPIPFTTDCDTLGYKWESCSESQQELKCLFNSAKVFCY